MHTARVRLELEHSQMQHNLQLMPTHPAAQDPVWAGRVTAGRQLRAHARVWQREDNRGPIHELLVSRCACVAATIMHAACIQSCKGRQPRVPAGSMQLLWVVASACGTCLTYGAHLAVTQSFLPSSSLQL